MTKIAAIVAVVNSVLALAIAFGVEITAEQAALVVAVANAGVVAVAAYLDPEIPWFPPTR